MMREGAPKTIYRKDYKAPDFLIDAVELAFDIFDGRTRVASKLDIQRNGSNQAPLVLDGESLEIVSLAINGRALSTDEYRYANGKLTIENVPDQVCFEAEVDIVPEKNTSLEGLYRSRTMYCTQCEAEGYRKITFGLDRPDVLSTYTVSLTADKNTCPVLLSNGNEVSRSSADDNRHTCLLYTSPSPRDLSTSRMPSSA